MSEIRFPQRLRTPPPRARSGSCQAHRAWVRRHRCCVRGCNRRPVECAHVRRGTDGAIALKPSDRWTVSLCWFHHREQHDVGEAAFEARHGLDLRSLAIEFARRSPHTARLL